MIEFVLPFWNLRGFRQYCRISNRYGDWKYQSRRFATSRCLMISLNGYWLICNTVLYRNLSWRAPLCKWGLFEANFEAKWVFWFNSCASIIFLTRISAYPECEYSFSLQWRHNGHDGVSNHQPHIVYPTFTHKSNKTSKHRVTGLCEGNSPLNFPHKGPVTRKMFPFDYVIMLSLGMQSEMRSEAEHSQIKHI